MKQMMWSAVVMCLAVSAPTVVRAEDKAAADCHVPQYTTGGPMSQATMTLRNDGGWCSATWSAPRRTVGNASIVTPPGHGGARTDGNGSSGHWSYRPTPGFTGHDSFVVGLYGGARNLSVDVTVQP